MILDKLENAPLYYGISENLACALRYLLAHKAELAAQPPGITKLTDCVQIKFLEYDTIDAERRWESHIEFTDVQYMIKGSERIGYNHVERMESSVRQEGKDQIIHQGTGEKILVPEGFFMVLFPQDVHMSKLADKEVTHVKKAAFKIRL
ncbi:YhcH/YjgK/YiaL family protein [Clostridium transplantifaecale]|uniref:YhcH/YjgK/YiaL family protein n=1 Tax=Clostridium transplantifaecale TaxID=2479838 RepID=UPI000F63905F|nr:YhcH/YjgK/YiaL family protein [Clostridium transplantifaecale]